MGIGANTLDVMWPLLYPTMARLRGEKCWSRSDAGYGRADRVGFPVRGDMRVQEQG